MRPFLERGSREARFFAGAELCSIASGIVIIALAGESSSPLVPFSILIIGTGILMIVAAERESFPTLAVIVLLGIVAALDSIYIPEGRYISVYLSRGYSILFSTNETVSTIRGFPIPYWYKYPTYSPATCPPLPFYCGVQPTSSIIVTNAWFFGLDAIFYIAVFVAIIQIYRGIRQKPVRQTTRQAS